MLTGKVVTHQEQNMLLCLLISQRFSWCSVFSSRDVINVNVALKYDRIPFFFCYDEKTGGKNTHLIFKLWILNIEVKNLLLDAKTDHLLETLSNEALITPVGII